MPRTLEKKFKHLLSHVLRLVVGSAPISLPREPQFNRILVIRQHNQLGDMLCVVPLLRALREKYPGAYIALMTSPVNFDVMINNRYVNKVIKYDKGEFLGKGIEGWKKLLRFIRDLRAERLDLAIVPSTVSVSFTSDLFAFLSGARVRIGASSLNGEANALAFLFNVPLVFDWRASPLRHQTQRNLQSASPLGLKTDNLELEITFDSSENEIANRLNQSKLDQSKMSIAYHVGAGKIPNRWEASRFAAVANILAREFNASTLVTSGPMDDEPVADMVQQLNAPYQLIKGKPIREVATILSTVDLVITNDTGIMHVAAAVGVPVLSLFGPTDPAQWAPIGSQHRWLRGSDGDINNISVGEVLALSRTMLSANAIATSNRRD